MLATRRAVYDKEQHMLKIPFVDLSAQYQSIEPAISTAIESVIAESAFIGGRFVSDFEKAFAAFHDVSCCIGVGNGTDALEIALESLDLPPGSEVIVPANSFIATSEAVTRAGHAVCFCDCDPTTYTISCEDAARRVTAATKAIIPVHLYGQPCDMDSVMELASHFGLKVIEDCAQAHGAEYKGEMVGSIGDAGTFSFYPAKNLGAFGDGGAIVTNNENLAKKCRMIANHGRTAKYDHEFEGRNSRLDGLQAAILNAKLPYLDSWTKKRRQIASWYRTYLNNDVILAPFEHSDLLHVYHLFVVQIEKQRSNLRMFLKERGIETGIHYPIALPLLGAYRYLGYSAKDFPVAVGLVDRILSLPLFPELTEEMVIYICCQMNEFSFPGHG